MGEAQAIRGRKGASGGGADKARRPRRRQRTQHPVRRRLLRALAIGVLALSLIYAVIGGIAALSAGRSVGLPVWALAETEARLNRAMAGQGGVTIGAVRLSLAGDGTPSLLLDDLRLFDREGRLLALLPQSEARFEPWAALRGIPRLTRLRVVGAQALLRRATDGTLDLAFGPETAVATAPRSFGELLEGIDEIFALPLLADLDRIEAQAMTLVLQDRRAGKDWTVGDGRVVLVQRADDVALDLAFTVVGGATTPAQAQLRITTPLGRGVSTVAARIEEVAAGDLAAQSPLLAWLGVLDAPISGQLRAAFDAEGGLAALEGRLELSGGALQPVPDIPPVEFDSAGMGFRLDPGADRLILSALRIDGPTLRLLASGHADLEGLGTGRLDAMTAQVALSDVRVDPEGLFAEPVRFGEGALDLRLELDPFTLRIGELSLREDGRRLAVSGRVAAGADGWRVAVDLALDAIAHDRLLALWPVALAPRVRDWLGSNVQQGVLFNVNGGLRLDPGQEPRIALGWEFADTDLRFMPTLPPILRGNGYSSIENRTYTLVLESGEVIPPEGGPIMLGRSLFRVADVTERPATAELRISTESSITAALSFLDQPPFGFISRAGVDVALAEGRAALETEVTLPLKQRVAPHEVVFRATGSLRDVRSARMAPGRVIAADRLELVADPAGIEISGAGMLGAVPFDAVWAQALGPAPEPGAVAGTLQLGPEFAAEFLSGLGPGAVTGAGQAAFRIDLPRGAAARYALQSDLRGVGLRIDEAGWTKPAAAPGLLDVSGQIGQPPTVESLGLQGPGLGVRGRVVLGAGGGVQAIDLAELRLGDWLRAAARIEPQGGGRPARVSVSAGTADLRRMTGSGGRGSGGTAGGGAGSEMLVALDRVTVSEGIALTGFRGTIRTGRDGPSGRFSGRVNGQAPVEGVLAPTAGGTAVRVTGSDAGAALAAAGIFSRGIGGGLDLTLAPDGTPGGWAGRVELDRIRVRDLPALAEILSAISVVGLLDQLSGGGILFTEAVADVRLTPEGVTIRNARATGASFGVTVEGRYLHDSGALDLRGVVSPLYIVNSIGQVVSRPGEGLIGFTFRVRGTAAAPRVTVNPLSGLAPGFLREVFRGPAPGDAAARGSADGFDAPPARRPDPYVPDR
ncbi:MAG: hypothetical protein ACK4KW_08535 [Gemmobacter sp.]